MTTRFDRNGNSNGISGIALNTALGLTLLGPAAAAVRANPSDSTYRLVFADEFNGTSVDTNKWQIANPGWTMPNSLSTATASQVSVGNGLMTMNATRTGANTWTSGSISTYQKYNFVGGYVEARVLLPTTPGSWPAFWGLYTGWPPEMDIMEYPLTTDNGVSGYAANKYSTNFHYTNSAGSAAAGAGVVTTGSSLAGTWHTFAADWTSGTSVRFLLDGNQVQSFNSSSVAQMANMYMILDYAVGGWPGTPSTGQWAVGASDQTKVDWVHVWQRNAAGDTTSTWNVAGNGALETNGNWANNIAPAYGNQTAVFGRVGTNAAATVSTGAWRVLGNVTFDGTTTGTNSGTTAYTVGTAGTAIQLASTTGTSTVQATSASTASQTIASDVELWSNVTARNDMTGGQTLNFNGRVSGNGTLGVTGAGTVQLNAPGIYTGGTNVGTNQEAATLRANADAALGTGTVVIGPGGNATTARLEIAGGHSVSNSIDLRGRATNTVGLRSVSGNNTLAGTVTAGVGGNVYQIQSDSGTLTLSGAAPGATAPGVALQAGSGNRVFTLQGTGNGVVSGTIQNGNGVVGVTKEGTGTWTLAGNNTYTGATVINNGTLRLAPIASTAVATYGFDSVNGGTAGGTVANTGTGGAAMNGTLTGNATIVPNGKFGSALSLTGNGSVNINNPVTDLGNNGSWTVSAWVNTTTPGSSILTKGDGGWGNGNTIFYLGDGNGGGSGTTPSAVRYAGGFLQSTATSAGVANGAWHQVTYVNSNGTYGIYVDGVAQPLASGNSGFANNDVGSTVRLGASTNTVAADGTVNFNGLLDNVQFYGQALSAAQVSALYQNKATGSLPATANVTVAAGATFDLNNTVQQVSSINTATGSAVTLGSGQLIVNNAAANAFAGNISGDGGSVTKTGTGTLALTGTNTYTGPTTVAAGTLTATADAYNTILTNAGGLDVQLNARVTLDYTGGTTPAAQVKAILDGGYASNFAGGQIRSTLHAANLTLGYGDNGTDAVVVMLTLPGDANLDGRVDFNDFLVLQNNFGKAATRFDQGNFDYDGATDFNDFLVLQNNFGQSINGSPGGSAAVTAAQYAEVMSITNAGGVPEPAGLAALALAAAGLLRRSKAVC